MGFELVNASVIGLHHPSQFEETLRLIIRICEKHQSFYKRRTIDILVKIKASEVRIQIFKVIENFELRAVKALLCLNAAIAEDMPIQMV